MASTGNRPQLSELPPDSEPWWNPSYPPAESDTRYSEPRQYPHPYRHASQSSGYSSADLSGCSRPDDWHSLSQSRDFQGNITYNFFMFNIPVHQNTATSTPFSGEHDELEEPHSLSELPPDSEPWWNPSYPPAESDTRYSEPRQYPHPYRHASQSSGYSSADLSGCSRPDDWHSLSQSRDFQGNITNNFFIFNSPVHQNTAPSTPFSGEHDELEELHTFPPRSVFEQASFGRRPRGIISRHNERLLNEFAPQLVDSMDARTLLPYLMRYELADRQDQEVISNPLMTNRDRNIYVIQRAPYKNLSAFEKFVKCLEKADPQSELATQLRQRMRKPSSAQFQPAELAAITQHRYTGQDQPSALHLATRDGGDLVGERLSESSINELETFRQRSCRSEFTKSTLVPTQPSIPANKSDRTIYESTLQRYPVRDIKSNSQSVSRHMQKHSQVTSKERRQKEIQAGFPHDSPQNESKMLMQQKLMWLQNNTAILNSEHEEIQFTSLTNFKEQRKVLHSGALYQEGKVRFVVLLTDFLLVLNPLEPHGHSRKAVEKQLFEEHMFSDNIYIANKLLLLHHLEVQGHSKQECSFSLCYKLTSVDLCFEAPNKRTRDFWLKAVSSAIKNSCAVRRRLCLPTGSEVGERLSGNGQRLSLTILKVSALIWPQEDIDYSRQLFCTVTLGQNLPRKTPSVEGKDTASWNFTFEFWRFTTSDTLEIEVRQENIFRPNDFLGRVRIPVWAITEQSTNAVQPGHEMEAALPLKLTRSGEINLKICT